MISQLRSVVSSSGISIIGLVLVAIAIWWIGPYIGFGDFRPLAGVITRLVLIVLVFVVWLVLKLVKMRKAAKADEQLADDLVESADSGADAAESQSADEVALLKNRFEEAIATLRESSGRRSSVSLYELPWFVIIGPPGSGKTTALINSGLEFPLEQRFGKEALRGVGGTRNCDWWFTNDAVLLDTAGRYTTQDSHASVDRAAWEGFLDLLKKYRKRRPINGVIVAMSLSDLMTLSDSERNAQVLATRHRIQELYRHFGIRFPVYMLFTKCDLAAGFIEYFDDLDQEGRKQVWGTTFPLAEGKRASVDDIKQFPAELQQLLHRLTDRMTWRMSQEVDQHRRSKIYNFPQQVIALAGTLENFLADVFSSSRYEDRILLRGIYFTSGTQEGTPIDRMMSVMARTFGMQEQALPSFGGKGRSYFITDLFKKIIFQESGIAGVNPRVERRRRWLQSAAYVGSIALAILATFAWIGSFAANRGYLGDVAESMTHYETVASRPLPSTASIEQLLPRLDALRDVVDVAAQHNEGVPLHMRMWLYQGRAMTDRAGDAYLRELNSSLGRTVMNILETRIVEKSGDPQALYQYLKAYLMLGDPQRMEPEQLSGIMQLEWRNSYGAQGDVYTRLVRHTDYLFAHDVQPYPVNQQLIEGAQRTLSNAPLADFLYARIQLLATRYDSADLVLTERVGLGLGEVFRRKSDRELSEPISALYTRDGFRMLFPKLSSDVIDAADSENWVLGREDSSLEYRERLELADALLERYVADYIEVWKGLLEDLEVAPFTTESQAMAALSQITAPRSALRLLLDTVRENTDLASGLGLGVESEDDSTSELAVLLGQAPDVDVPRVEFPGAPIAREFAEVNRLVAGEPGQPTLLDPTIQTIAALQTEISQSGGSALDVIARGGGPAVTRLRTEAGRQPEPLRSWLTQLSGGSQRLAQTNAQSELQNDYSNTVLVQCRNLIANRYPFNRNSEEDVAIDDFGRMFGYGGVLDTYFTENLANFVDRSGSQWRVRPGAGIRVSASTLQQFQRAQEIREAFFRTGGQSPEMQITVAPDRLDAQVGRFVFEVDGQSNYYEHTPVRDWDISWPGQGAGGARITFEELGGNRRTIVEDGPWAFFRLLDGSTVRALSNTRYEVEFNAGGRSATVVVLTKSVNSPMAHRDLHDFRCPSSL